MGEFGGWLFLIFLFISLLSSSEGDAFVAKCAKAGGVDVETIHGHTCLKAEEIKIDTDKK